MNTPMPAEIEMPFSLRTFRRLGRLIRTLTAVGLICAMLAGFLDRPWAVYAGCMCAASLLAAELLSYWRQKRTRNGRWPQDKQVFLNADFHRPVQRAEICNDCQWLTSQHGCYKNWPGYVRAATGECRSCPEFIST